MTREEAERRIKEKLREIVDILKKYNPNSNYFGLHMRVKDNWFDGNNEYWPDAEDENMPINFYGQIYEEDE